MDKREEVIRNFKKVYDSQLKRYVIFDFGEEPVEDTDKIILKIKDKDLFFDLLTAYAIKYQELIEDNLSRSAYEVSQYLFLRATNEDFNDICAFLKRELDMANDDTFTRFKEKQDLGFIPFLGKKVTGQVVPSGPYDENTYEFHFELHDDLSYLGYVLPVVRFGILNKNGKKTCIIGSIQNKTVYREKHLEKKKYKVNDGVPKELCTTEPKKIISLLLFIDLMNESGIEDYEIHGLNVLDYNFHLDLGKSLLENFKLTYENGYRDEYYESSLEELDHYVNREEDIVKFKTEDMYNLVDRLKIHYPSLEIKSYPDELGSNYLFKIPRIKDEVVGKGANELHETIKETFEPLTYSVQDACTNKSFNIEVLENLSRHGSSEADYILGNLYSYGIDVEKKPWVGTFYFRAGSISDNRCRLELSRKIDVENELKYLKLVEEEIQSKNIDSLNKTFDLIAILKDYIEREEYTTDEIREKVNSYSNIILKRIMDKACDDYDLKNSYKKELTKK